MVSLTCSIFWEGCSSKNLHGQDGVSTMCRFSSTSFRWSGDHTAKKISCCLWLKFPNVQNMGMSENGAQPQLRQVFHRENGALPEEFGVLHFQTNLWTWKDNVKHPKPKNFQDQRHNIWKIHHENRSRKVSAEDCSPYFSVG